MKTPEILDKNVGDEQFLQLGCLSSVQPTGVGVTGTTAVCSKGFKG